MMTGLQKETYSGDTHVNIQGGCLWHPLPLYAIFRCFLIAGHAGNCPEVLKKA
jgi:hypothetical protein